MEEGYVDINHIPTRVITVGGWIDQPIKKRHLIIVIPGKFVVQKLLLPVSTL